MKMKKLMIVALVAMSAVIGNAATVSWASGAIGRPGGESGNATALNTTASLIVLTASEYTALQSAVSGMSAAEISTYVYNTYKGETSDATASWSKGSATLKDATAYSSGQTAYAVVLYTSTVDSKEYYIGNYASWEFAADANKTMNAMGTKLNGTGDALSWQAVPEPTSGLLMLVGLAGLALRRKRA
jgi:hypothetical protein